MAIRPTHGLLVVTALLMAEVLTEEPKDSIAARSLRGRHTGSVASTGMRNVQCAHRTVSFAELAPGQHAVI